MTFSRPHNVRFVDMAIWCDQNAYKEDCDIDKLYQYLYWLFWMQARKYKYFKKESEYDEYSLQGATTVYLRLKNPKQFDGSGKLQPVKSVLNYIKTVSYPLCVAFQQQFYSQPIYAEDNPKLSAELQNQLVNKALHLYDGQRKLELQDCLSRIKYTARLVLRSSPYKNDKLMMHNLYISCLLTILNYLKLDRMKQARLDYRENRGMNNDYVIDEMYSNVRHQPALLFRLEKSMSNYVSTLVNTIMEEMARDLVDIMGSFQPPDAIIKAIIASPIDDCLEVSDE